MKLAVLALAATAAAAALGFAPASATTVELAGLFPFAPAVQSASPALASLGAELDAAFRIACADVNAHPDGMLPPGVTLSCKSYPISLDEANIKSQAAAAHGVANTVGIVGPVRSAASLAVSAQLASLTPPMPHVSPASTNPTLVQPAHANFFRTVPSDNEQAKAALAMMRTFGCTGMAIIATTDAYAGALADAVEAEVRGAGLNIIKSERFDGGDAINAATVRTKVESIAGTGARFVYVSALTDDALAIYNAAAALKYGGNNTIWMGPDGLTAITSGAFAAHPVPAAWMRGTLATAPRGGHGLLYYRLWYEWAERPEAEFPGNVHSDHEPAQFAAETYDAVFAYAHALKAVAAGGGSVTNKTAVREALRAVNFAGTAGTVSFAADGGPAQPIYDVDNLQGAEWKPIGSWEQSPPSGGDANEHGFTQTGVIAWPGNTPMQPSCNTDKTVELAGLFPFAAAVKSASPALAALGAELDAAFRIACLDVNSHPDGLLPPGVHLQCKSYPISLDETNIKSQAAAAHGAARTVGIVGPVRSAASLAVSAQLKTMSPAMPHVSPASTNPTLVQPAHANFFRTVPSDNEQAKAALAMLRTFGCTGMAIVATTDAYAGALADAIEAEVAGAGLKIVAKQRFEGGDALDKAKVRAAVAELAKAEPRFVYVSALTDDALAIYEAAAAAKFGGPGTIWMGPDGLTAITSSALAAHPVPAAWMRGTLATAPRGGHGVLFARLWYEWAERPEAEFPGNVHSDHEPAQFASETYDAVFAYAYALKAVAAAGGDVLNKTAVREALRSVNFLGTGGQLSFGADGGPAEPIYDVDNLQGAQWKPIGSWAGANAGKGQANAHGFEQTGIIAWPGNPPETPQCNATKRPNDGDYVGTMPGANTDGPDASALTTALIIFVLLCACMTLIAGLLFWKNRQGVKITAA